MGAGKPAHVPLEAVAVPPTRGFLGVEKVGAGAVLFDGAIVVPCVDALKRTEAPESLERVTRTLVNLPESAATRRYVEAVAPVITVQALFWVLDAATAELQRSH